MPQWKFTRNDIPAFVFLIDCITEDNEALKADKMGQKALYRNIADIGPMNKESISERTIERAFSLREQVKCAAISDIKSIHLPKLKTLDIITRYYFSENPIAYLTYKEEFVEQINERYAKNGPEEKILDAIFKKLPPKIILRQEQIFQLEELLAELSDSPLEDFVEEIIARQPQRILSDKTARTIKTELESLVSDKIKAAEKEMRNTMLLYRWLGGFGLLFAATPQFTALKEQLLDDFLSQYESKLQLSEENDTDTSDDDQENDEYDDDDDDYGDIL